MPDKPNMSPITDVRCAALSGGVASMQAMYIAFGLKPEMVGTVVLLPDAEQAKLLHDSLVLKVREVEAAHKSPVVLTVGLDGEKVTLVANPV